MTKQEFRQQISELLNATLESGPGPRAVSLITAEVLAEMLERLPEDRKAAARAAWDASADDPPDPPEAA
jgi:hypothetical protein